MDGFLRRVAFAPNLSLLLLLGARALSPSLSLGFGLVLGEVVTAGKGRRLRAQLSTLVVLAALLLLLFLSWASYFQRAHKRPSNFTLGPYFQWAVSR